jgi:DNA ligase (NAD+)
MAGTKEEIIDLNARLTEASEAYYKKNQPILQDAEFDALERQLKGLVAKHPEFAELATVLARVGNDLAGGGRTPHTRPMLSIENTYEEKDLLDWYANLFGIPDVCLEPKFDGISVSLLYKNRKLVRALTRGDGKSGEDITLQARAVNSIPKTLAEDTPAELEIRGELVMENFTLERINREAQAKGAKVYSSTRNLTGGTMKTSDLKVVADRQIQIRPWDVFGDDSELPDSGLQRLQLIAASGFPAPLGKIAKDSVEVGTMLQTALIDRKKKLLEMMSLETDGVVVKVDSHKLRRQLGVSSKYTNYQVCFKPQSASGTTYLRSIQWQVGRTGKVSPVAICDPVILAGAKVTNANLNNITWIREKGLKLGAKVEMLRSGDVIPQIMRVLDEGDSEILPPSNCPECRTSLEESDEGGEGVITHRCPNRGCPGRVRDTLTFIGSRDVLEIDNLGPEMAGLLIQQGVHDIADFFEFITDTHTLINKSPMQKGWEQSFIDKGFSAANLRKMVLSAEKAKTASWERWVKALAIPMIGATLGKTIAMELDLQSGDMSLLVSAGLIPFTAKQVDGFGEAKMKAIRDWCTEGNNKLCFRLSEAGIRPTPVEKPKVVAGAPLKSINFCITGEFSEERESIAKKLVSLGASNKNSVSSKVNLLIVGDGAGKNKLKKAEELGIKQVGKDWLVATLVENGLQLG